MENHVVSNNSFDTLLDTERYQEANCSGEIFGDFDHDGGPRGLSYYNIGNAQRTNQTTYHLARVKRYGDDDSQSNAAVLAFKDANTLCLLESDETNGTNIDQTVQTMSAANQCLRKSSLKRFQSLKANPFVTTSSYAFKDLEPTQARLKNQLDAQANAGFRLVNVRIDSNVTSDTASSLLTTEEMRMRNLYIKDNASNAAKWQYQLTTVNTTGTSTERHNLFKAELTAQASQGFRYRTQYRLDQDKGTFNIYEKRVGDTAVYTVDESVIRPNLVTATTWTNYANELGKAGCRLEYAYRADFERYSFLCTNSNLHNGTYDYRWIPLSFDTKATEIKTILDQQKAAGYIYRFNFRDGNDRLGLVLERDSSNSNTSNLAYKVFDGSVLDDREPGASVYLYTQRLIGQSSLGWNLWATPTAGGSFTGRQNTLTIYTNHAKD
ncbi:hypothetical protein FPL18_11315 [Acinetobacter gyllenbergii]|nr:hypothetical protein FPL18_11315 [Acinetobacter gyllenbergii]